MAMVISVDGLRKHYSGIPVVDGISFEVSAGEIFGVLGPNGAGKTTTVECVQGLRRGDSGTVSVLGLDPWQESAHLRRRIGSQLQESGLPDRIRVGEALSFFARPGSDWGRLIEEWGLATRGIPHSPTCPAVSVSAFLSLWLWSTTRSSYSSMR